MLHAQSSSPSTLPDAPQPKLEYTASQSAVHSRAKSDTFGAGDKFTYFASHLLVEDTLNGRVRWDDHGASFMDRATSSFMNKALMPALLHQDPRYYPRAEGNIFARTFYAASRVLITRDDDGKNTFNTSEWAGSATAAVIGNAYRPQYEQTWGRTGSRALSRIGSDAGMYVMKEFLPGLKRRLLHRMGR